MSSRVDPYVVPIPAAFQKDPEIQAWAIYDNQWKHDMWQELTGGAGQAEEFEFPDFGLSGVEERISNLELASQAVSNLGVSEFEVISITGASYTTTGSQIIICNNTALATITLNANPDDGEEVKIKRRSSPVIISGSIDGQSNLTLGSRYDAPHLVYTIDGGEWSII